VISVKRLFTAHAISHLYRLFPRVSSFASYPPDL
jgi:hypothetical protein